MDCSDCKNQATCVERKVKIFDMFCFRGWHEVSEFERDLKNMKKKESMAKTVDKPNSGT